jgi:hypothetical protein
MQEKSLSLSKQNEYFIAIAKQEMHSFLMLGVMIGDTPTLLARVGKLGIEDPDSDNPCYTISKILCSGNLARLADEGINRGENHVRSISYQAYSINYEQVEEFLILIAQVEQKQLKNKQLKNQMLRIYGVEAEEFKRMHCYIPVTVSEDGSVKFEYKKLCESEFSREGLGYSEIADDAQILHLGNNCRTTALNIFETILGFVTDVSRYFFFSLRYQCNLLKGQPEKERFYILPPPPTACEKQLSDKQRMVLGKIYERLEQVPLLDSDSVETRAKFVALKDAYKEIAGQNNLSAEQLLQKILQHEQKKGKELFAKRSPWLLSRFFALPSTTEKMFKEIERDLQGNQDLGYADLIGSGPDPQFLFCSL